MSERKPASHPTAAHGEGVATIGSRVDQVEIDLHLTNDARGGGEYERDELQSADVFASNFLTARSGAVPQPLRRRTAVNSAILHQ